MDPIAKLKDDHRAVEELFARFEQADASARQGLVEDALTKLETHSILEEELIYPAIRRAVGDQAKIDKAVEEHHVMSLLGAELRQMQATDDGYAAKFSVLGDLVRHHVKEEETEILPEAAKADIDWTTIGERAAYLIKKLMAR